MIYSCFQQAGGVYAYFEVPGEIPLNADLPVPRLPAPTGNIGVPSIEAGRPLPANAKFIGTGWHAKGMIARCDGRGLGAMPPLGTTLLGLAIVGGIAAGAMYWLKQRRSKTA
jgi:hypothetical protein